MYTIVACLFGIYDASLRTAVEMEGYEEYLASVADEVAALAKAYYGVGLILSGGITNHQAPEVSEAASVKPRILQLLEQRQVDMKRVVVVLEEKSINTAQNIRNSVNLMVHPDQKHLKLHRNIIVVTDAVRKLKVLALVRREKQFQLGLKGKWVENVGGRKFADLKFQVKAFPRRDIHPNSRWHVQLLQATAIFLSKKVYEGQLRVKRSW